MSEPQVVLVTGASSGIGRAAALLAAAAATTSWSWPGVAGELEDLVEECVHAGAASAGLAVADMSDEERICDVVRELVATQGRLDAVIHCAGILSEETTGRDSTDELTQVVSSHLRSGPPRPTASGSPWRTPAWLTCASPTSYPGASTRPRSAPWLWRRAAEPSRSPPSSTASDLVPQKG